MVGVFTGLLSAPLKQSADVVCLPLLSKGTGGGGSCFAASSFARADRCDSEKLRNFSMLNLLVLVFSGCTGGETGRSVERASLDRREADIAYSLVGRGEVGGSEREGALIRGVSSSSARWLEESWSAVLRFKWRALRRLLSRGMAGTRYR